jgi:hypothetical protein
MLTERLKARYDYHNKSPGYHNLLEDAILGMRVHYPQPWYVDDKMPVVVEVNGEPVQLCDMYEKLRGHEEELCLWGITRLVDDSLLLCTHVRKNNETKRVSEIKKVLGIA